MDEKGLPPQLLRIDLLGRKDLADRLAQPIGKKKLEHEHDTENDTYHAKTGWFQLTRQYHVQNKPGYRQNHFGERFLENSPG